MTGVRVDQTYEWHMLYPECQGLTFAAVLHGVFGETQTTHDGYWRQDRYVRKTYL